MVFILIKSLIQALLESIDPTGSNGLDAVVAAEKCALLTARAGVGDHLQFLPYV
ncbi:hypothetical protein R6Q57_016073, partial [Mikania cordata]